MRQKKELFIFILLFLFSISFVSGFDSPTVEIKAEVEVAGNGNYILNVEYIFPDGYHQSFQPDFFNFEIIFPDTVSIDEINYPQGENFYGHTALTAVLNNFSPAKNKEIKINALYQLCNEQGMCLFPQTTEIIVNTPLITAEQSLEVTKERTSNIFFFLLLAFLGGILLNIMPCVLPVLSIKALNLVNQNGSSKKEILKSSLLYATGVITSLIVLAVLVVILKLSGEQVGWGFQFQSKNFVLILLTVVFVFALSLFEVFTISAPVLNSNSSVNNKQNGISHFITGVFAVLLATPCSAPFLGTAAGFAFSQSAPVIIAIFFMVGLGLSLPFIVIGFFPSVVKIFPKPGAWMNTFREIMGFLLMATCIWLVDVLSYQGAANSTGKILIYLIVTAFAFWLYGKTNISNTSRLKKYLSLLITILIISITAGALFFKTNPENTVSIKNEMNTGYSSWAEFSPDLVENKIGGEYPVFVAFSAKWCMTCRTNESTVIFSDDIKKFFKENNVVLIHGDYTNKNDEIDKFMKIHSRAGVPFYLWYPANSKEGILLPELLKRSTITNLSM